jgi:hypothetical protein
VSKKQSYQVVRISRKGNAIVLPQNRVVKYERADLAVIGLIQALIKQAGLDKVHPKIGIAASRIRRAGRKALSTSGAALATCAPAQLEFLRPHPFRKQESQGVLWFSVLMPAGCRRLQKDIIRSW